MKCSNADSADYCSHQQAVAAICHHDEHGWFCHGPRTQWSNCSWAEAGPGRQVELGTNFRKV